MNMRNRKNSKKNPSSGLPALLLAIVILCCVGYAAYIYFYKAAYPLKYNETVTSQSEKHDLPPQFVFAVVRSESSFRPDVESSVGARGLMQIREETFDWIQYRAGGNESFDDLFDPEINLKYGTTLLRLLFDEFKTPENVLCAYHAGWGSAKKWLADPKYAPDGKNIVTIPFSDTSHYVGRVMETMKIYEKLYDFEAYAE